MQNKPIVRIEQAGRTGYIYVTINKSEFKWFWEFGSEDIVALIKVPTSEDWNELFPDAEYNRNEILSYVAEEICRQKCNDCKYDIMINTIRLIKS